MRERRDLGRDFPQRRGFTRLDLRAAVRFLERRRVGFAARFRVLILGAGA